MLLYGLNSVETFLFGNQCTKLERKLDGAYIHILRVNLGVI